MSQHITKYAELIKDTAGLCETGLTPALLSAHVHDFGAGQNGSRPFPPRHRLTHPRCCTAASAVSTTPRRRSAIIETATAALTVALPARCDAFSHSPWPPSSLAPRPSSRATTSWSPSRQRAGRCSRRPLSNRRPTAEGLKSTGHSGATPHRSWPPSWRRRQAPLGGQPEHWRCQAHRRMCANPARWPASTSPQRSANS